MPPFSLFGGDLLRLAHRLEAAALPVATSFTTLNAALFIFPVNEERYATQRVY